MPSGIWRLSTTTSPNSTAKPTPTTSLDRLLEVIESLAAFPERRAYPKELVALGIREYRQTSFKPYRVIYRVMGQKVYIYLIADGRRDMQSLLMRRLLGG